MKVSWAAAALLSAVVLAALWITASRMKDARLAARRAAREPAPASAAANPRLRIGPDGKAAAAVDEFFGQAARTPAKEADIELDPRSPPERQREVAEAARKHGVSCRFVAGDGAAIRIALRSGERLRVESFTLYFWDPARTLSVHDARGTPCVEFLRLKKGQRRGWQELQLTVLEVEDDLRIEVQIRPGAASFGAGAYGEIRPGLRIGFENGRTFTVARFDARRLELRALIEAPGRAPEEHRVAQGDREALGLRFRLERREDGRPRLVVDSVE